MSTNDIHILGIVGRGAIEAEAMCTSLQARATSTEGSSGSSSWSDEDRMRIDELAEALLVRRLQLPTVYAASYVDGWSVAPPYELLEHPDGRSRVLYGDRFGLAWHAVDAGSVFSADMRADDTPPPAPPEGVVSREDAWYRWHLRQAVTSVAWLGAPFIVIAIAARLGSSRLDDDLRAALDLPLDLAGPPPKPARPMRMSVARETVEMEGDGAARPNG